MQQTEKLKTLFAEITELFEQQGKRGLSLVELDILKMKVASLYEQLSNVQPATQLPDNSILQDTTQTPEISEIEEERKVQVSMDHMSDPVQPEIVPEEQEAPAQEEVTAQEELPLQDETAQAEVDAPRVESQPVATDPSKDKTNINEILAAEKKTLADKINLPAGGSLKKQMDVNARFFFTRELFGNNQDAFDKAVRFIDNLASLEDANVYIEKELAVKYNWEKESKARSKFNDAVKLRFHG
ncbi:MAG: hypothetical protein ABR95_09710 [Sphingobacteriales bacterium BACL12 MAG-120813-bin55]|jgi:hypothetical protein|nr:MAG: hypothetical protein ABR94_07935 [Sphingobacteriales bacterium BACL12 MAG-120802-bin5]KRP11687.1 MAG: hypothetical protein ABR95_09710 [Sphingobacteriales bacterium BACL12 MAG-120813-bin55]